MLHTAFFHLAAEFWDMSRVCTHVALTFDSENSPSDSMTSSSSLPPLMEGYGRKRKKRTSIETNIKMTLEKRFHDVRFKWSPFYSIWRSQLLTIVQTLGFPNKTGSEPESFKTTNSFISVILFTKTEIKLLLSSVNVILLHLSQMKSASQ